MVEKEKFISQLLKKIEKAKKYVSEPNRFTRKDSHVELASEHGTRNLMLINGKWHCSCDFFAKQCTIIYNGICSHTIAIKELGI